MADHSRRTTILLTVVAILFILTIIILCLPYDIGHQKSPSKDRIESDKIHTTTPSAKYTTPTTTPSTTPSTTMRPHIQDTSTSTSSITSSTSRTPLIPFEDDTQDPSTSTPSTTRKTHIHFEDDTTTTDPSITTSIHSTDIVPNTFTDVNQTTSKSSSTWSTSSHIPHIIATGHTTEGTTLWNTDSTDDFSQTELAETSTEDYFTKFNNVSTNKSTTVDATDSPTTVVETEPPTTVVETEPPTTSTSTTITSSTSTTTISTTTTMAPTIEPIINETECIETECIDFSAKMWLQRNYTTDPCTDFYQYACGAVVDSQSMNPEDAGEAIKQKIRGEILGGEVSAAYKVARDFYDSCFQQDPVKAGTQWRETSDWMDQEIPQTPLCDTNEITSLLAKLMKNNFGPLFDVSLGLNDTGDFVVRVTPPILKSPFSDDIAQQYCLKEYKHSIIDKPYIDVEGKYDEYLHCMAEGYGMEARLYYLKLNLRQLNIQDQDPHFDKTIDFFNRTYQIKRNFRSEDVLQLDYQPFNLEALNVFYNQVNWTLLIADLFDTNEVDGMQIQLYMDKYFTEINSLLSEQPVCAVLSTLWKESVYMELVSPQSTLTPYSEEYCLDLTTSLFPELLYSVNGTQLAPDARDKVLESIMTMENSTAKNKAIMAEIQASQKFNQTQSDQNTISILGNHDIIMSERSYQMKSLLLMKRFRSEMYNQMNKDDYDYDYGYDDDYDNKEYYLTMYTAFDNAAFHPENKYYSAASYMLEEPYYKREEPAYLSYPGLGAAMARTAVMPRNQQQDADDICVMQEELKLKGDKHSNITLKVSLKRMEFARSLSQMVWDGYMKGKALVVDNEAQHLQQRDFAPLPLLDSSTEELFYLKSAQIYCEKSSSLDLLAVKERGHIPGPIRVNRILMNEPGFHKAFGCETQQQMCNGP